MPWAPPEPLPPDLAAFVASAPWREAASYRLTWPHEYIVRTWFAPEGRELYQRLAEHVLWHGEHGWFYRRAQTYLRHAGHVYWIMTPIPRESNVLNRCLPEQTYAARLAAGTLPEDRARRPKYDDDFNEIK